MLPLLVIVAGGLVFAAFDFHLFRKIKREDSHNLADSRSPQETAKNVTRGKVYNRQRKKANQSVFTEHPGSKRKD